ncbi:NAD(P)/FAD-dependent oxidoreductase [Litorimonas sp. WD9-15]|uniref:NAD(P)/FAD-dependent oxidoreductase n=1 Tax=Litorimonas sp. WD9-15 TaxID=3418716 RepID=UPI003CFD5A89
MTEQLSTDYLVIGSGAMGMAFVDTLLDENPQADIIMVDRFAKPGGHWNSAYPFVTLHQPSAFYGVNSRELSQGRRDEIGLNKGLGDLATGAEILAYFEDVMRQRFLTSGRVRFFPMCDYQGEGKFSHKLSDQDYGVEYKKLVDCTHLNTSVPSTHKPNFMVDADVTFIPLNDLPKITTAPSGYTVIGGGKTGIDALLWLLENNVPPAKIRWVKSRDAWLINRENTQPDPEFFEKTIGNQANMMEAIASATSKSDMYDRLEACGYFLRIDPNIRPTMFHGATISEPEMFELRKIKDIVRKGRVASITSDHITFVNGRTEPRLGHVIVDCSASAIKDNVIKPIFNGDVITPQTVRAYQPVFSAAMAAWIECNIELETDKNGLMGVVPLPDDLDTFIRMTAANMMNQVLWGQNKKLRHWMRESRLDGFSKMVSDVKETDTEKVAILQKLRNNGMGAMAKLQSFMSG